MNTDTDFHPYLRTSEFSQIPDSQNENKAQEKDLRLISQHSDGLLKDQLFRMTWQNQERLRFYGLILLRK